MKIEVKERDSKEFYDEFLFILTNYKKIMRKPTRKVHGLTLSAISYGASSLAFAAIFLVLSLINAEYSSYIYMAGMFGVLVLLSILYFFLIKARITTMRKKEGTATFEMKEDIMAYSFKDQKFEIKWEDVKAVVINNYSISVVPNKEARPLISIGISHKDEIIDTIKKLNKENLLVDNTKLYKNNKGEENV